MGSMLCKQEYNGQDVIPSRMLLQAGCYPKQDVIASRNIWARCYHKQAFVNTNLYVLKYVYMKGKVNRRLDNCIDVLLKLARDKGKECLVKIEKGENTEKLRIIKACHQSSLKLPYKRDSN